mmetsp:Transcript_28051/g.68152  ORF Transcript_28051/g.68152 Transcript_28051/m.68152 type:complete len:95 (+) Transcript_28051:611-895(+)
MYAFARPSLSWSTDMGTGRDVRSRDFQASLSQTLRIRELEFVLRRERVGNKKPGPDYQPPTEDVTCYTQYKRTVTFEASRFTVTSTRQCVVFVD